MSATIAMPGLVLDKRKIDAHGLAMSGYLEALHDMLSLLQHCYTQTGSKHEKAAIEAIMEPLEARAEEISRDLNLHAHNIGALRIVSGEAKA